MGARAVLIGRAYAYGLGAAGEAGVARALEILREDVDRTLRLLGCRSVLDLSSGYVEYPPDWRSREKGVEHDDYSCDQHPGFQQVLFVNTGVRGVRVAATEAPIGSGKLMELVPAVMAFCAGAL